MPSVLKNLVEKMVIKFRFGSEKREKWGVVRVWELAGVLFIVRRPLVPGRATTPDYCFPSSPGWCYEPGLEGLAGPRAAQKKATDL